MNVGKGGKCAGIGRKARARVVAPGKVRRFNVARMVGAVPVSDSLANVVARDILALIQGM